MWAHLPGVPSVCAPRSQGAVPPRTTRSQGGGRRSGAGDAAEVQQLLSGTTKSGGTGTPRARLVAECYR